MVNPVSSGGYQPYSYQQASAPVQESRPRSGENRVEPREAPAGDSQRADQREDASQDAAARVEARRDESQDRGQNVDVSA